MSATGSLILDSEVRGILDTNTLYGTAENIEATGSSNLNGLSSSATASVVNPQTAQALLGAITSISSADVAHFAEGATNLGALESLVETVITKTVSAQALFDSLSAQAEININVESGAESLFGGLESSATLGVVLEASGEANLGGLSASGTATGGEPPVPPTPEPVYGSRGYVQKKIKPKLEPVFEPEIPKIVQTKPLNKIVLIKANTLASNFNASAEIRIDFSIRQDEAELLLLI